MCCIVLCKTHALQRSFATFGLPSTSLNGVFGYSEDLNCNGVLSILFFMVISFFVLFMFAHPKIMKKLLIVFFETFVVLLFTFRPLIIYLDLVFLYGVR